jgi:hypothetical protein
MSNVPLYLKIIQNLIAIPLIFYYLIKPYKDKTELVKSNINNAVFLREGVTFNIIPKSLQNEFSNIYECPLKGDMYINNNDKIIISNMIKKYWKTPFFILKCMIKMAIYSNVIHKYKPKAIITHNEYSFASSVLTMYCGKLGVEHINVMHGEKLFNIRDAFVEFDRFYVWDKHYENLFTQLRAEKNQFKVEFPDALCLNIDNKEKYVHIITYYLGGEDESELTSINNDLLSLEIPLNKICIRYHPRYSDINIIKKIFRGYVIENPNEVDIEKSLSMTKYVTSLYSTVLYQAYVNGKKVVINDLSSPRKYELLDNLNYIMIRKPHIKLSELFIELNK